MSFQNCKIVLRNYLGTYVKLSRSLFLKHAQKLKWDITWNKNASALIEIVCTIGLLVSVEPALISLNQNINLNQSTPGNIYML